MNESRSVEHRGTFDLFKSLKSKMRLTKLEPFPWTVKILAGPTHPIPTQITLPSLRRSLSLRAWSTSVLTPTATSFPSESCLKFPTSPVFLVQGSCLNLLFSTCLSIWMKILKFRSEVGQQNYAGLNDIRGVYSCQYHATHMFFSCHP